jgi:hypothetical protein
VGCSRYVQQQVYLKKSDAGRTDGIYKQRPIQEQISRFTTRLGNNQAAMASSTMKGSIVGGSRRVVISTDRVTGA